MSEFYCLWCLFLLETAVICSYWYVFGVSLKSVPRYVNSMRPGCIFHIATRCIKHGDACGYRSREQYLLAILLTVTK